MNTKNFDMTNDISDEERHATLITSMISAFIVPFLGGAINVALPNIGAKFRLDSIYLSWMASSFLLSTVIFLLPVGRIADIYGRKKIYFLGAIVTIIGLIIAILANTPFLFLISRIVQGAGSAMLFSTTTAIIMSVYPPSKRGKAIGIAVSSVYLGGSLGPVIGGVLVNHFGYKSIFLLSLLFIMIVPILIKKKMHHEWREAYGESYDFIGTLIFTPGIFSLMYGLSILTTKLGMTLISAGIILIILFVLYERKKNEPLFKIKIFTNNNVFLYSSVAAFIHYAGTFGVGMLLALYLQYIKGFTPQHTGILMFIQPIFMAITSPIAGKLSDKKEPQIIASIGMFLTCIGILAFTLLTNDSSIAYILTIQSIIGVGFGLFSSPNTNAIMASVKKQELGIASSTTGAMRLTGQMVSMGIITVIFTINIGKVEITPQVYNSLLISIKEIFTIFAILCAIAIIFSYKRGKIHNNAH